jgi:hypothetical protein
MSDPEKNNALNIEENDADVRHRQVSIVKIDGLADLDVGAKALDGQVLDFTEEGASHSPNPV